MDGESFYIAPPLSAKRGKTLCSGPRLLLRHLSCRQQERCAAIESWALKVTRQLRIELFV